MLSLTLRAGRWVELSDKRTGNPLGRISLGKKSPMPRAVIVFDGFDGIEIARDDRGAEAKTDAA